MFSNVSSGVHCSHTVWAIGFATISIRASYECLNTDLPVHFNDGDRGWQSAPRSRQHCTYIPFKEERGWHGGGVSGKLQEVYSSYFQFPVTHLCATSLFRPFAHIILFIISQNIKIRCNDKNMVISKVCCRFFTTAEHLKLSNNCYMVGICTWENNSTVPGPSSKQ